MTYGQVPNLSHLRIFECAVYVPRAPPQRTKMGPQRRLEIYVGYVSPSIIRYLEPQTDDLFTARFADCHFNEDEFSLLGGGIHQMHMHKDIQWCAPSLKYLDPPTKQRELEVEKSVHLQNMENQLPNSFPDTKKVAKSYISTTNAPSRVEIPRELELDGSKINEPKVQLKRGRPIGSKYKNSRKKKMGEENEKVLQEEPSPRDDEEKYEISINYAHDGIIWDRDDIDDENRIFFFSLSKEIDHENDDPYPNTLSECQKRPDWEK